MSVIALHCPKCGHEIQDEESAFCKSCGAKLKEGRIEEKITRYYPLRLLAYICLPFGIILIIAGVLVSIPMGVFTGHGSTNGLYPQYAFPSVMIGVFFLIIGIAVLFKSRTR
jgi:thiosulfate reductase cytochrome b subunit